MRRLCLSVMPTFLLAACVPAAPPVLTPPPAQNAPARVFVPPAAPPGSNEHPPAGLARTIQALGQGFDGKVGIAVRDVQAGWQISYNGQSLFPQQSVSKTWVAMTVLDAVDRGAMALSDPVTVRREDFTVFHQPIRALVGPDGYATTVRELLVMALTTSDNTANDILLRRAGGPEAVRAFFVSRGLGGIRFGPGERLLQSRTAGLTWKPEYAIGDAFFQARAALPMAVREKALRDYLADPIDGATPDGIVVALGRLKKGDLLSSASTQFLLSTMAQSKTGPQRMRAGSGGWAFAHKTGTGQELGGLATGYNDVALLTAPDGHAYALAVLIGSTRRGIPERQRLMQDVARAVVTAQEGSGWGN